MPLLFISYKRGTTSIAPLMDKLRAAKYRLWFDRDDVHLGDPDWQAKIDRGLELCGGVILGLSPLACSSIPVQYEVKQALALKKPIFPLILERLPDIAAGLREIGLSEKQHVEDFTDVTLWERNLAKLFKDLEHQRLHVTRHELRAQRGEATYHLHQQYLKKLADDIGSIPLAQIVPDQQTVLLESVYVDSPTDLKISVEVENWHVIDWWIDVNRSRTDETRPRTTPESLGYERAALETHINVIEERIAAYHAENPKLKPDEEYSWRNNWNNGEHLDVLTLQVQDIAAACDRLVILGGPGSGKSTFVKHLALCLAGAQIVSWGREANLNTLGAWPHRALTPIYVELRRFVTSKHFPQTTQEKPTVEHLWQYIVHELLGTDLAAYADELKPDLHEGHAVLILDGLDEVPYDAGQLNHRQQQLRELAQSINTQWRKSRLIVASRPYAYEGWKLPDYEAVTIADFENKHRIDLARRLYREAGKSDDEAAETAKKLNAALVPIDPELKDRPLFVTMMATLFLKAVSYTHLTLPTNREV